MGLAKKSLLKISVIIITYNQEELIKRALDSVLVQKEWIYEIIIADDCSTDNNWNVIGDYAGKYPDLIKPYRNEKNLGIFGNIESTWNKPTGDAIIFLSGDDTICDGLFEEANKLIIKNNVRINQEAFCLYFDYKIIYPKKWMNIFGKIFGNKPSNKLISKNHNPINLKIRGLIVNRTIIYSRKVQDQFTPVPKNMGIFADGLIDIQVQKYSEKNYYSPFIGSEYFAKVGVSVNTSAKEAYHSRYLLSEEYKKRFDLSAKDIAWLDFINMRNNFFLKPSIRLFYHASCAYFRSIDFKYGIRGMQLRMFIVDLWYLFNLLIK
jgi:glycosyltransferase involved in cell wall biosynthesis